MLKKPTRLDLYSQSQHSLDERKYHFDKPSNDYTGIFIAVLFILAGIAMIIISLLRDTS